MMLKLFKIYLVIILFAMSFQFHKTILAQVTGTDGDYFSRGKEKNTDEIIEFIRNISLVNSKVKVKYKGYDYEEELVDVKVGDSKCALEFNKSYEYNFQIAGRRKYQNEAQLKQLSEKGSAIFSINLSNVTEVKKHIGTDTKTNYVKLYGRHTFKASGYGFFCSNKPFLPKDFRYYQNQYVDFPGVHFIEDGQKLNEYAYKRIRSQHMVGFSSVNCLKKHFISVKKVNVTKNPDEFKLAQGKNDTSELFKALKFLVKKCGGGSKF